MLETWCAEHRPERAATGEVQAARVSGVCLLYAAIPTGISAALDSVGADVDRARRRVQQEALQWQGLAALFFDLWP